MFESLVYGRSCNFAGVALGLLLACKPKPAEPGEGDGDRSPPVAAEPEDDAPSPAIERARTMTKSFAGELKSTLLAAIEEGGPAHAISVCKQDAPNIAAQQSNQGWVLSRTALRVRNPDNAPTDWQRAVLDDWRAQLDAGEVADVASLEWSETVGEELRYMRAIPLGGVCLACHGPSEDIAPEVKAALAEHYPSDAATGFRVGELRGAFVVTGPA